MKISYEWLASFFANDALPAPEAVAEQLIFHAYEVEGIASVQGTSVLDVDVLANRAPDSLSHRGVAREVAAICNVPLQRDPLRADVSLVPETDTVRVTLDPDASCSFYTAARVTGVSVGESPQWLRERLEAIGQKSINNVVDATNYVLFELGQPTHVFDAQKMAGEMPHVGTRHARAGETITLLGGEEVTLTESMTLIVDRERDAPLAVAGVKGGVQAEVDAQTTDIIIEAANFDPRQTRLTAQALKLRTDASARFENHVADRLVPFGARAVVDLIVDIAGGELQGFASAGELGPENPAIDVSADRVARLLGVAIDADAIERILERLAFSYERDGDSFTVTAPFERRDVTIPEDVIEEIGRVHGYAQVPSEQLPAAAATPAVNQLYACAEEVRAVLGALGFTEVYTYSLRGSGDIALKNALASDKDHLRSDLAVGIREVLDQNERRAPLLGLYDGVRVFEIGAAFPRSGEAVHVCIGVRMPDGKKRDARTAEVLAAAQEALEHALGSTIDASPEQGTLEFNLSAVCAALPQRTAYATLPFVAADVRYESSAAYPFVLRDIAAWVPEGTAAAELEALIRAHAGEWLVRADLFDEFTKDGRTSYALHLVFQSREKTLSDSEVNLVMESVEQAFSTAGFEVR